MAEAENQPGDGAAATATPAGAAETAQATASPQDTTLLSRIAGLDAKVTTLVTQNTEKDALIASLQEQVSKAQSGVVDKDEALRAQVAAKDAELAQVRQEAAITAIKAQYPETFSVLGTAAASLTADQLAASEARFAGVAAVPETPVPVGNNAPRPQAPAQKAIEDMSLAELRTHLRTFPADILLQPLTD
jgi:hypothetical protein